MLKVLAAAAIVCSLSAAADKTYDGHPFADYFVEAEKTLTPILPARIDELTSLLKVSHSDDTMFFVYQLDAVSFKAAHKEFAAYNLDGMKKFLAQRLPAAMKKGQIANACHPKTTGPLIKAGANYHYKYIWEDGSLVTEYVISAVDCK